MDYEPDYAIASVYQGLYLNFVLRIIPERNDQGGVGDDDVVVVVPVCDSPTSSCAHNMEIN